MFVTTNCLSCGQTVMVPVEHFNTHRVAFHMSVGQRCHVTVGADLAAEELAAKVEELKRSMEDARLRREA